MPRFHCTAEHTRGASVSHCCKTGSYDDPANVLDLEIDAADQDTAVDVALSELSEMVDNAPACPCGRSRPLGGNSWWESVAISAIEQMADR